MAEVASPWTDEQLKSEDVSKKQLVEFLQAHGSLEVCCLFYQRIKKLVSQKK